MSAPIATPFKPTSPFVEKPDNRAERPDFFRSTPFYSRTISAMSSTSSANFSSGEPTRQILISDQRSQTQTTSSINSFDAIPRNDFPVFAGWRDQCDEDEDIETRETQRFPTSYLRHRCSTPVEDEPTQQNYVWGIPKTTDDNKMDMMDQDVEVKIEEVDISIESNDEATFWRVSGPGFVWRPDCDEQARDFPMDEAH